MEWKRFDQETPKQGQFIVAVKSTMQGILASTATTYLEDGDMENKDWKKYFTHWMPLPEIPCSEQDKKRNAEYAIYLEKIISTF